jgi:hypothetical protein
VQIEHRKSRDASWTIEWNSADRAPHTGASAMKMQTLATELALHGRNAVRRE